MISRNLVALGAVVAAALAATLRERGHEPILAPLMEIHFREGPPLQLDDYQIGRASCRERV